MKPGLRSLIRLQSPPGSLSSVAFCSKTTLLQVLEQSIVGLGHRVTPILPVRRELSLCKWLAWHQYACIKPTKNVYKYITDESADGAESKERATRELSCLPFPSLLKTSLSTGPAFKLKYYQEVVVVVEGSIFTVRLSVQRIFSTSPYYRILEWGY